MNIRCVCGEYTVRMWRGVGARWGSILLIVTLNHLKLRPGAMGAVFVLPASLVPYSTASSDEPLLSTGGAGSYRHFVCECTSRT
jgi:hypothetical protein